MTKQLFLIIIMALAFQGYASEQNASGVQLNFISTPAQTVLTPFSEGSTVNDRRGNYLPLAIGGTITLSVGFLGLVGSGLMIGLGSYMIMQYSVDMATALSGSVAEAARGAWLVIMGGVFGAIFFIMTVVGIPLTIAGWALHAKYSKVGALIDTVPETGDTQMGLVFRF